MEQFVKKVPLQSKRSDAAGTVGRELLTPTLDEPSPYRSSIADTIKKGVSQFCAISNACIPTIDGRGKAQERLGKTPRSTADTLESPSATTAPGPPSPGLAPHTQCMWVASVGASLKGQPAPKQVLPLSRL